VTAVPGTLSLPFGDLPAATDPAVIAPHDPAPRLWLCLFLPDLPLEVVIRGAADPVAILSEEGRQRRIRWCDPVSRAAGVEFGMPVNSALALLPGLSIRPREQQAEADALQRLALRCLRLTPRVVIDGSALLLEVAGSLSFFGSVDAICEEAAAESRALGYAVQMSVAPTARAALWFARAGSMTRLSDAAHLVTALVPLPLVVTGWSASVCKLLRRMGVRRLGDCLRLPRDGLARRIGAGCLADIDEALGRRPELRPGWSPPERHASSIDLPAETREAGPISAALDVLLRRLEERLGRSQEGARLLWIHLQHRRFPATLLRIGLLRPTANAAHLGQLAAIHLAARQVPAPVSGLLLEADVASLPEGIPADFFDPCPDHAERFAVLVERLRMRLGLGAVHGLAACREHRPERAWQALADWPAGSTSPAERPVAVRARPSWMLEEPRLLGMRGDVPLFRGPLQLGAGPERIETGWWDSGDIRRDYYEAWNPQGLRLWIFRDGRTGAWYLHGLFG